MKKDNMIDSLLKHVLASGRVRRRTQRAIALLCVLAMGSMMFALRLDANTIGWEEEGGPISETMDELTEVFAAEEEEIDLADAMEYEEVLSEEDVDLSLTEDMGDDPAADLADATADELEVSLADALGDLLPEDEEEEAEDLAIFEDMGTVMGLPEVEAEAVEEPAPEYVPEADALESVEAEQDAGETADVDLGADLETVEAEPAAADSADWTETAEDAATETVEDAPAGEQTPEEVPAEVTFDEEETVQAETSEDEVAEDETAVGESIEEEAAADEIIEEESTEEDNTEDETAEEEPTEEDNTENETSEEEPTKEEPTEEEPTEEENSEDDASEEEPTEDETAEEEHTEDEISEEESTEDETAEEENTEDEISEEEPTEDETAEEENTEDEISEEESTEGESTEEENTEDDNTDEENTEDGSEEDTRDEAGDARQDDASDEASDDDSEDALPDEQSAPTQGGDGADEGGLIDVQSVEGGDYIVTAGIYQSSGLPGDARLYADELTGDAAEAYLTQAEAELGALSFARFFDIGFRQDGDEVEPTGGVQLDIHLDDVVEGERQVLHFTADGGMEILGQGAPELPEVAETPVETQEPVAEAPVPEIEQPEPVAEAPVPVVEQPAPEAEVPAVEAPATEADYDAEDSDVFEAEVDDIAEADFAMETVPEAAADIPAEVSLGASASLAANAVEYSAAELDEVELAPRAMPEQPGDGTNVSFSAGSFSVYAVVCVGEAETWPAQDFEGSTETMKVSVSAPEGAFPADTTMDVTDVDDAATLDAITGAVEGESLSVKKVHAVDITFRNAEGEEIEPLLPIAVTMTVIEPAPAQPAEEQPSEDQPASLVVHVDGEGGASVVEQDEIPTEAGVAFTADAFSVYAYVEVITTEFLTSKGEVYEVTVTYGPDAKIPQGSSLSVTEFAEDSVEYADARRAVLADKLARGEEVDLGQFNLAALDISILNPEGVEIEPEAAVKVDIRIKSLPGVEDLSEVTDTLAIQHHVETEDGIVVEQVYEGGADATFQQETDGAVLANPESVVVDPAAVDEAALMPEMGEALDAEFKTEVFSTFTVTWRSGGRTVTVHYVDENGRELTIANPDNTHPNLNANSSSPAFLIYDIDGYEYSYTYRNTNTNGSRIAPLLTKNNNNRWQYMGANSTSTTELSNGDDIYVVYKSTVAPTSGGTPQIDTTETWPEGNDAPQFGKSSTNNGDGTNTISLSIKAAEKPVEKSTPADIIVVFDVSGSMSSNMSGEYGWEWVPSWGGGYWAEAPWSPASEQRLALAKTAVNTMANTLLNGANSDVRMALISFSTSAEQVLGFTNNYTTFSGKVNGLSAGGGTNWEKALQLANNMEVRSDAATYVVFVTDGDPTFRVSRGDVSDGNLDMYSSGTYQYYRSDQVFGEGNDDSQDRNFDFAVDQVAAIKNANKNFYAIGISNDVTKVQNLTTQGGVAADHAFIASDNAAMQRAFESITESIKSNLGFGNVQITDGITDLTHVDMKVMQTIDPNSFKYYRYGGDGNKYGPDEAHKTEWTTRAADGCGPAGYNDTTGSVEWNMGSGFQLENGVTYVVEFRAWPSQEAYDLVADLNNGVKVFAAGQPNSITDEERAQVVELAAPTATTQGIYTLKTNTDEVRATYNKTTKSGDVVTISDDHGVEATYHQGTIENMALESMKLTVKKEFEDDLTAGEDRQTQVTLVLKRRVSHQDPAGDFEVYKIPQNGVERETILLNVDNEWTYSLYIAPGLIVDGEVLEDGYDFILDEPGIDYHYDLIEEIINPMVVNGEDKYYGDGKLLNGETIDKYVDQSLTALNRVKAGVDVRKIALDEDGNVIYPDEEFTIRGKLLDPDGQPYTWTDGDSVDASGAYHKYDRDGNRVIYKGHFADSSNISFTLKAGEYVRFINVPEGCSFQFSESSDMPDSYEQVGAAGVTQHKVAANSDEYTTEGDTQPTVSDGTVSVDRVVGNKQYSVTFTNQRVVNLPRFDLVKVDEDNTDLKLNGAEFKLYADADRTTEVTRDADGNALNLVTDNREPETDDPDGWAWIGKLDPGTYYLYETKAPRGYVLDDETPVIITVTKNDGTVTATATRNGANVLTHDEDADTYTITVKNRMVSFRVYIEKTNDDTTIPLNGAHFALYDESYMKDGAVDPEAQPMEDKGDLVSRTIDGEDGLVDLGTLTEGTYYLVETQAPDGFNTLTKAVVIHVDPNSTILDGNQMPLFVTYTQYTMDGNSETNLSASHAGIEVTTDENGDYIYTLTVVNQSGAKLPSTGGAGTRAYTVAGLLLILGAALLLVRRRVEE